MSEYKNFGLFGKIDNNRIKTPRGNDSDAETCTSDNTPIDQPQSGNEPFLQTISNVNGDCLIRHRRLSKSIDNRK